MSNEKVVIVTGGAQGIGLGIVRHLLQEDWRVAVLDADAEAMDALHREAPAGDDRLLILPADVALEDQVVQAVEQVVGSFGRLDGLINNAGIANPVSGPVERLALTDWQRWLNVNLTGPFLLCKHCVAHLTAARGAIINIASTRAYQSEADGEAYAASKGGLIALTHALAVSLSGKVRVNAISPGWIVVDDLKKPSRRRPPRLSEEDHHQHPAGRAGRAEDVASMCSFLLSESAGFITGQDIVVDGGMTRKMIYV